MLELKYNYRFAGYFFKHSYNRTMLELKLAKRALQARFVRLIIVQCLNWNWFMMLLIICKSVSYNRTMLELKFCLCSSESLRHGPYNRTMLELKLIYRSERCFAKSAYNRTMLELKWGTGHPHLMIQPL